MGSRENTARIGGDEFTVIVKDVKSREDVLTLAKKLGDAIKLPISAGEQQANISCSMGVCFYPDHARTAEELVKRADKAMYKAKNSGDGRVYVYSQEEFLDSDRQARILAALPKAISNHEFSLAYQPIHDIATHQSKMAEALLRWHHPELGNVSPDEFIPLAEQSDMISKIGEWVLHEVCLQIKQWRSVGFEIAIAMNVSSRQLTNPQFAEQVLRCLDQYQIPNGLLEIEITETAMMTHSSLARLAKLPVNRLKIDRSFICEVETSNSSRALIKAIVSMADSLGMQVIAEGIENEVQKSFLRSIGCTRIQGFLMSRPKPASETLHRIEQLKEALPE